MYLSENTGREQGVHVRCDILCPGVLFCGLQCVGWSQECGEILGLAAFQGQRKEKCTVRMALIRFKRRSVESVQQPPLRDLSCQRG